MPRNLPPPLPTIQSPPPQPTPELPVADTQHEVPEIQPNNEASTAESIPNEAEQLPILELDDIALTMQDYETDENLGPILRFLKFDHLTGDRNKDYRTLLLSDQFFLREEKMYYIKTPRSKKRINADGPCQTVLAIPKRVQNAVLKRAHANFGHFSGEKLFQFLRLHVYFKGLYGACFDVAQSCDTCQRANVNRNRQVAPMQNTPRFGPGEAFYFDHKILPKKTANGTSALLVITESFSNFTLISPVSDLSVEITVKELVKRIWSLFPQWKYLISDRHQTFKSKALAYLNKLTNVKHHFSASLSPRGHALVERLNLEINKLIRKYAETDDEIPDLCPLFEYILNINPCQSHAFSPHEVLFGQKPSFNLNQEILESEENIPSTSQYVTWLKNKLKLVRSDVDRNVLEARLQQKHSYDAKFQTTPPTFKQGDLVLLESLRAKPNSKSLASHRFFDGPFYIGQVVQREKTHIPTTPNPYPGLDDCSMGVAYQLIDSRTGKTLKSLINSRRLKAYVSSENFEAKYPPLRPQKPKIQSANEAPSGQKVVKPTKQSRNQPSTVIPLMPKDWYAAKHIIRQRKVSNQLEFLVRFTDNSTQWIPETDVSNELKRRFFLKKNATRRRTQRNAREAFR